MSLGRYKYVGQDDAKSAELLRRYNINFMGQEFKCTEQEKKAAEDFANRIELAKKPEEKAALCKEINEFKKENLRFLTLVLVIAVRKMGGNILLNSMGNTSIRFDHRNILNCRLAVISSEHLAIGLEEVGRTGQISESQVKEFNYFLERKLALREVMQALFVKIYEFAKIAEDKKPSTEAIELEKAAVLLVNKAEAEAVRVAELAEQKVLDALPDAKAKVVEKEQEKSEAEAKVKELTNEVKAAQAKSDAEVLALAGRMPQRETKAEAEVRVKKAALASVEAVLAEKEQALSDAKIEMQLLERRSDNDSRGVKIFKESIKFWQRWLTSYLNLNEEQQQHLLVEAQYEAASAQQQSSLTGSGSSGMWSGSRKADDVFTPLLGAGAQQEESNCCCVVM